MKTLVVPNTPDWEKNKYQIMKFIKPDELVLLPYIWGQHNVLKNCVRYSVKCATVEYKGLKYIAVKKITN